MNIDLQALLRAGLAVPVGELLYDNQLLFWEPLREAMTARGWQCTFRWIDQDVELAWVPPETTREQAHEIYAWSVSLGLENDYYCYAPQSPDSREDLPYFQFDTLEELLANLDEWGAPVATVNA